MTSHATAAVGASTTIEVIDLSPFTGSWALDPKRTLNSFHTKTMWVMKLNGTLKALEGRGSVGADGSISGSLVIDMASVDTKIGMRDRHLRGPDFFDVAQHPTMTFTARSGRALAPGKVELVGDLLMHGQSRPLTLLADVSATTDSLALSSEFEINRSDWGMSWAEGPGAAHSLKLRIAVSAHFDRA